MKKILQLLMVLLFSVSVFSSCEDENNNDINNEEDIDFDIDDLDEINFFTVGDSKYNLAAGVIENYGKYEYEDDFEVSYNGYRTDLILFSEQITFEENEDEDEGSSLIGNGQVIYFNMFSKTGDSLDVGVYTFTNEEPCPIGTFYESFYILDYDSESETITPEVIKDGTVTVLKDGNEYIIKIDCTSESDKEITGIYKGTLKNIEITSDTEATQYQ